MAIQLNPLTKVVEITSPTTTVTVQELVNAIRDWEDELANLSYAKVIDAVGKADLGGGVSTSITLTLSSTWQIQFWSGVGIAIIKDGTTVGGVGGNPVMATGGADTVIVNNTVGGTVGTISGTVPTVEQIADGVWDEDLTGHTTSKSAGWFVQKIKAITDAILAFVT